MYFISNYNFGWNFTIEKDGLNSIVPNMTILKEIKKNVKKLKLYTF